MSVLLQCGGERKFYVLVSLLRTSQVNYEKNQKSQTLSENTRRRAIKKNAGQLKEKLEQHAHVRFSTHPFRVRRYVKSFVTPRRILPPFSLIMSSSVVFGSGSLPSYVKLNPSNIFATAEGQVGNTRIFPPSHVRTKHTHTHTHMRLYHTTYTHTVTSPSERQFVTIFVLRRSLT